ncbi:ABC transporter ATP-binding protein [Oleiharenicola sp. Vm1]|uniref:ABC transporter ATP-binding protein n=1 Tax=Oleiharenicola sp. Vm1 TaxID=3398393 RepID=UPI0039F4D0A7
MTTPPPSSDAACELRGLTKVFGHHRAVDGLDLRVARGEFYAFLGPNGAGKTTTLRMTAGLLAPTAGQIFLGGIPLRERPADAKRVLAYVPDEPVLYGKLRPLEQLEFVAVLWNVPAREAAPRAEELLRQFDLWDKRGDYIETFSRGMMQKMALAGALIHRPQVLLLDEPLTGLDAQSARFVKDLLNDFVRAGHTVILTTHILEVAERMAQRIGIIHRGRLAAEGTLEELRARSGHAGGTLEDVFLALTRDATPPPLP